MNFCEKIPQKDIDPQQYLPPCNSLFSFIRVTDNELVKVLQSLKPSKVSGLDNSGLLTHY